MKIGQRCLLMLLLFGSGNLQATPDLVVEDFGFTESAVREHEGLTFWAQLKNQGDTSTSGQTAHAVTFFLNEDGKRVQTTYSSGFRGPLQPGDSVRVRANEAWLFEKAGQYSIIAEADDVDRIKESNEQNNELQRMFTVLPNPEARKMFEEDPVPQPLISSSMELVPNGDFSDKDADGKVVAWSNMPFVVYNDREVIDLMKNQSFEWDARGKVVWDEDYIFSYDIKLIGADVPGNPNVGVRAVIWPRLPEHHEPPGGPVNGPMISGTHKWTHVEIPVKLSRGITRFLVFFTRPAEMQGRVLLTNLSLRPMNTRELVLSDTRLFGETDREQMTWIWSTPGFSYEANEKRQTTVMVLGGHMGRAMRTQVTPSSAWFRRSFTLPQGAHNVQAVFTGDDRAVLFVNEQERGYNEVWQDIKRVPLDDLTPGTHQVIFKVSNSYGLAGLLGRIEWMDVDGERQLLPTNTRWEVSTDEGETWQAASAVAVPIPALTVYDWVYPHLDRDTYSLAYDLSEGVHSARFNGRATNSFRLYADDKELGAFESVGKPVAVDLGEKLNGASRFCVEFEEIGGQPPAGNCLLELSDGKSVWLVPIDLFRTDEGKSPEPVDIYESEHTWPISMIGFEAASSRPLSLGDNGREGWLNELLSGAMPLWKFGEVNGSSSEFASMKSGLSEVTPETSVADMACGLELREHPQLGIRFNLEAVPAKGTVLVLDVEDADALTSQCAVYVNGVMVGLLQLIGYDQLPGGRLTQRAWAVTIDSERMVKGENRIELRMIAPYYDTPGNTITNQSEEYIQMLALGDRDENPYASPSWFQWDAISLYDLSKVPDNPVNGRPVWLGTNAGYYAKFPVSEWKDWILRDLSYIGFTGTDSMMRFGIWTTSQLRYLLNKDPGLPEGMSRGDWIFSELLKMDITPYPVFEPGRALRTEEELDDSHEAEVLRRFGTYFDIIEIGNEVDHPYYGFDLFSMAMAAATMQKESAAGRKLLKLQPPGELELMGQGWYHAWDFATIDAHARKESVGDPGYTEALSAHSYGASYIIPAMTYASLYGPLLGNKDIWVTECGAWTPNDADVGPFDLNIRGNLAFANHLVQYVVHPYTPRHRQYTLLSTEDGDAEVLEKARCYRRYVLAYGCKGSPLTWAPKDGTLSSGQPVLVRAVDAGNWWIVSLVNFSNEPQAASLSVTLPQPGTFEAERYADGQTVKDGSSRVVLKASPKVAIAESLRPGESIEYVIRSPK